MSPSSPCPSCGAPTCGPQEPWLQINATPSAPEAALLPALAREAELWREQGARDLWLLRKDPGLRLRLRNLELAAVRPGLARLQAAGLLSTWFPGVYEPEYHQFGGPAATAAVHTYFAADTRALLLAASSSQRRVSTTVVSLAILNDLFERCLQVHEEVWDVWSNLDAMYRGHARPGAALLPLGLPGLRRLGGPTELALADLYEHANTELAAALDATWRRGELTCGRRSILPYLAAFHWNRHGFEPERMATLSDAMARAWNPKRNLRGAAIDPPPAAAPPA
ncbi:MAG: thiopeptide-type bacteriocin biosynthesis protein [Myxococcales bacterium]|nr:thiopeptide-type bacteriocin biosynthesis protein [Myxococcales bacterium]